MNNTKKLKNKYLKLKKEYMKLRKQLYNIDSNIKMKKNTHVLHIQNPSDCPTFDYIVQGIKTVEGRKYSVKYQEYNIGDILIFVCGTSKLNTIIKDIRLYKTLEDYLQNEGFNKVLPCVKTMEEAINMYNRWSNPIERQELLQKYGYSFMAIEIEKI